MTKEHLQSPGEETQTPFEKLWQSLSNEQKLVLLAFPLVKPTGESVSFIAAVIGSNLDGTVVQSTLEGLVTLGVLHVDDQAKYTPVNPEFVSFIQVHTAEWNNQKL